MIGLISDTHGLLRPEALDALEGVKRIIHAGDVGNPEILQALERIAPVTAVRGNVDIDPWAQALPEMAVVAAYGFRILVLHDLQRLDLDPAAAGFAVVVSGHTHKPSQQERDGVLYLNPGSAGPKRFALPICLGMLDLEEKPWRMELIGLAPKVAGR